MRSPGPPQGNPCDVTTMETERGAGGGCGGGEGEGRSGGGRGLGERGMGFMKYSLNGLVLSDFL